MERIRTKLRTKFGENQSNGSEVIQVFVYFIIAAPPSWIPLFSNFWPIFSFSATSSMLERNLMHMAWTVQKLWSFVNYKFSLYFNMGFHCACALNRKLFPDFHRQRTPPFSPGPGGLCQIWWRSVKNCGRYRQRLKSYGHSDGETTLRPRSYYLPLFCYSSKRGR